jgi:hypothetical protein
MQMLDIIHIAHDMTGANPLMKRRYSEGGILSVYHDKIESF